MHVVIYKSHQMKEILGKLYVGSIEDVKDGDTLARHNITSVLRCVMRQHVWALIDQGII